jgi:hypothetical protein
MKIMKQEEKLEEAKMLYKDSNEAQRYVLELLFPELAESKDERIRKALIDFFSKGAENGEQTNGVYDKDILAWLENQGEQEEPQVYETKDGEIITHSETDGYKVVEPKFKVGDWVVRGNTIAQILDIQEQYYVGLDINGKDFTSSKFLNDDKIHLWTIKDAKDGNVLQLGGVTAIFKEYISNQYCKCYCSVYDEEFVIPSQDGGGNIYGCYAATPATKEQRDQLEKAMTDAGYTFDFDKKELKEIEDEEYDGEDYGIDGLWHAKNILEKTLGKVDGYQTDDGILDHKCAISAVSKLYKEDVNIKNRWKPSDEHIHWLKWAINRMPDTEKANEAEAVLKDLLEQLEEL